MKGQLNLFEPDYIKDMDCNRDTPVVYGSLVTGEFTVDDVYAEGDWMYPAGAFHGAEGGPC